MTILEYLKEWEGSRVQAMISTPGVPSQITLVGDLLHDEANGIDSLEGWYLNLKPSIKGALTLGTLDFELTNYEKSTIHDQGEPISLDFTTSGGVTLTLIPSVIDAE